MALKVYAPTTSSRRGLVLVDRSSLWKGSPLKRLTRPLKRFGGRNNAGRITVRSRGGGRGHRIYRVVDFKRTKYDMPARVVRLEYDPNRTAFIALIEYEDSTFSYILAPQGLEVGASVISSARCDVKPGNAMPLSSIPAGTLVHNVEMKPGKGGQMARCAGGSAQVVGRDQDDVMIKVASGEIRRVNSKCMASVGVVSNADHSNESLAKAGRRRWKGRRPHVRGVAMNPVDHPHGGGEGKTSGGRHPVSPTGKSTKGMRTRRNKRTDRYIVRSRHIQRRR